MAGHINQNGIHADDAKEECPANAIKRKIK